MSISLIVLNLLMQKFPLHSKEAWLQKALQELPEGKSINDLLVKNDLFVHDGFPTSTLASFDGPIKNDVWQITADIADLKNSTAMAALENGAECLYLKLEETSDFSKIVENIRLDYITTFLNFNDCTLSKIEKVKEVINSYYPIQDLALYTFGIKDICNTIQISALKLDTIPELVTLMKNVINTITNEDENILIEYQIGTDFYKEITKLRAIKILVANIKSAVDKRNKILTLGRPMPSDVDFNHSLIKWSFEGMAAVIGNVDFLSLCNWSDDSINEARLAQNIQHLFKEESGLHLFEDAMAGSYFIEDATLQIVEKVWAELDEV